MKAYFENLKFADSVPVPIKVFYFRNFSFPAHWHPEIELIYVEKGAINVGINGVFNLLGEGGLAICNSGDIHAYETTGDLNNAGNLNNMCNLNNACNLNNPGSLNNECNLNNPGSLNNECNFNNSGNMNNTENSNKKENISSMNESEGYIVIFRKDVFGCSHCRVTDFEIKSLIMQNKKFESVFKDMINAYNSESSSSKSVEFFMKSALYELFGFIEDLTEKGLNWVVIEKNHELPYMQKVLKWIEANYTEDICLEQASEIAGISRFHLSRVFRQITGLNFRMYLNKLRIEKALYEMSAGKNKISSIAYDCGFNSIRSFNRNLRRYRSNA